MRVDLEAEVLILDDLGLPASGVDWPGSLADIEPEHPNLGGGTGRGVVSASPP